MTIKYSSYDLQDILAQPFKQENGKKRFAVLLGVYLAGFIIPLLPSFFAAGYAAKIMHRITSEDGEFHLPSWDNIGEYFTLGLKTSGAAIIYTLPSTIFMLGGYIFMLFPLFTGISSSNLAYMSEAEMMSKAITQMGFSFGGVAIFGIGVFLSLPLSLILPIVITHLVAEDRFSAAFEIKKWWRILKANPSGFFIGFILSSGLYFATIFAAQLLYMTLVLCILIPILLSTAIAYITIIASVVFAIAYKDGVEKLSTEETQVEFTK